MQYLEYVKYQLYHLIIIDNNHYGNKSLWNLINLNTREIPKIL